LPAPAAIATVTAVNSALGMLFVRCALGGAFCSIGVTCLNCRRACRTGSSRECVVAEIVPQPECLVAVAVTVELAPGIAVGIARLEVAPEGVHRPIAVGPHVQRASLPRGGAMPGVRIDRHHAPELALALG